MIAASRAVRLWALVRRLQTSCDGGVSNLAERSSPRWPAPDQKRRTAALTSGSAFVTSANSETEKAPLACFRISENTMVPPFSTVTK